MDLSGLLSNNAADQKFMSPLVKTYTKGQSLRLILATTYFMNDKCIYNHLD